MYLLDGKCFDIVRSKEVEVDTRNCGRDRMRDIHGWCRLRAEYHIESCKHHGMKIWMWEGERWMGGGWWIALSVCVQQNNNFLPKGTYLTALDSTH